MAEYLRRTYPEPSKPPRPQVVRPPVQPTPPTREKIDWEEVPTWVLVGWLVIVFVGTWSAVALMFGWVIIWKAIEFIDWLGVMVPIHPTESIIAGIALIILVLVIVDEIDRRQGRPRPAPRPKPSPVPPRVLPLYWENGPNGTLIAEVRTSGFIIENHGVKAWSLRVFGETTPKFINVFNSLAEAQQRAETAIRTLGW